MYCSVSIDVLTHFGTAPKRKATSSLESVRYNLRCVRKARGQRTLSGAARPIALHVFSCRERQFKSEKSFPVQARDKVLSLFGISSNALCSIVKNRTDSQHSSRTANLLSDHILCPTTPGNRSNYKWHIEDTRTNYISI